MQCPRCDGVHRPRRPPLRALRRAPWPSRSSRSCAASCRRRLSSSRRAPTPWAAPAHNDLSLADPSISKAHARIDHQGGSLLHRGHRKPPRRLRRRASACSGRSWPRRAGAARQRHPAVLGRRAGRVSSTEEAVEFPWVEQQQLLLSLVQALNSTLVLSQVLEQVLDALMRITARRARLPAPRRPPPDGAGGPRRSAGLHVRVARRRGGESIPLAEVQGLSSSVVRKALRTGETVATGNAVADPVAGRARRASSSWTCARSCASPCARRGWRPGEAGGADAWARSTWTTPRPPPPSARTA